MSGSRKITLRIVAIVIGVIAAPLAWTGADLAVDGGSLYYVIAGVLMLASAIQLLRAKPSGFHLFTGVLVLTLAWAVYEAGTEFWLVGSRIWLVGILWLILCTPVVRCGLWEADTQPLLRTRTVQIGAVPSVLVLVAMTVNLLSDDVLAISDTRYGEAQNPSDWVAYGASNAGTRYAPHDQINKDNVSNLTKVWQIHTGKIGRFSGTPIQIDDGIYLCTAQNVVIALDADTGDQRWRFDPENDTPPYSIFGNYRGVTYHHLAGRPKGQHCAERIFTATTDSRLIALDKGTGEPCQDFGTAGQVSLLAGMGEVEQYFYMVTSPPTLASGVLVVGGLVLDNQKTEAPSGVVRAYDPQNGSLAWAWDMGREGDPTQSQGVTYTRGTPNVWSITSADDELGLVYVPTGNATPDYFGAHRTDVMNEYASSVVAIDARTGQTRWHYRTAHNDIWDYDVPSQPTLLDLQRDGETHKAVIVPTKRAEIFLLDRETGELLADVEERPVPQSDLPEEISSATQPFSAEMPSFAYPHLSESDMFGYTPFDQMACRKTFVGLRYEGPMTPPSTGGTLLYPGPGGGMNWGSVAVDEERQLMVVNNLQMPFVIHMIPREEDLIRNQEGGGLSAGYGIGGAQRGTPYAATVFPFNSPWGLPCLKPPYGEIAVVDLNTLQVVWRRGMGPLSLGFPSAAGSVVTRGGLIFNGGVMDGQLRAIDILTGEVVWQDSLPAPSDATPMSYVSPTTGKQYVIVTAPGASGFGFDLEGGNRQPQDSPGGTVIAYALSD